MPIEIITSSSKSSVLRLQEGYPYWSSDIVQDFVSVDSLNDYVKESKSFTFQLRAKGNAYIIFILNPKPYYHIVIGDTLQNDTCSTFNPVNSIRNYIKTSSTLLNNDEFRGFWVKWTKNTVYVGREHENEPFLIWNDTHLDLNLSNLKIGFSTLEVNGTWIIDDSNFRASLLSVPSLEGHTGTWTSACGGNIPPGAIAGGLDNDETLYVARAYYHNKLLPGKLHPSHGCCYITTDGREFAVRDYEVLCTIIGEWIWMRSGDSLPSNALKSICRRTGEIFHIGRGYYNGGLIIGKVFPSTKLCYVGYDGRELLSTEYEIFITDN